MRISRRQLHSLGGIQHGTPKRAACYTPHSHEPVPRLHERPRQSAWRGGPFVAALAQNRCVGVLAFWQHSVAQPPSLACPGCDRNFELLTCTSGRTWTLQTTPFVWIWVYRRMATPAWIAGGSAEPPLKTVTSAASPVGKGA